MRDNMLFAGAVMLLVSTAAIPTAAIAAPQPSLPTCLNGLASEVQHAVSPLLPGIVSGTLTTTLVPAAPANPGGTPGTPTPFGATPAYCLVSFTYSSGASGPLATVPPSPTNAGVPYPAYSLGETQQVEIAVALPLNSADGGTGGIQGNWTGGMMTTGGSGSSGEAPLSAETPYTEGLNMDDATPGYAIRQGFISTMTDTGQIAAAKANDGSSSWFLTTAAEFPPNAIVHGPIADWLYRGTHYGKQWGDAIAAIYYGKSPQLHYYNGCSGGGNQGMGQLQNFGDEYDGFLIGAPAYRWNQLSLSQLWPALVWKKLVQLGGTVPTPAQQSALNAAITAACDVDVHMHGGLDAVADGIVQDPRLCALHFR